jgi:2-oxo-4-hydroxy-4-carboxy-5-ureidoimidazoline decarboxylase
MTRLPDLAGRPVEGGDLGRFLATYGHLFEHSPWVAERAFARGPFADAAALHTAMTGVLGDAGEAEQLALLRAHPRLADKAAIAEGLTEASAAEQASAGLDRLTAEEFDRFHALNQAYQDRFGFPFIVCVRLHDKAGILAAMQARLSRPPAEELAEALAQVGLIVWLRLADVKLGEEVAP